MSFDQYLTHSFDLEKAYADYKSFLSGGDVEKVLLDLCPAVSHLCSSYITPHQGDFDDFCNNALAKIFVILSEIKETNNLSFLPTSQEFRNFFYTCARNSFLDTIRELGYNKYYSLENQLHPVSRKASPRFLTDYNLFLQSIEKDLLEFVRLHDRYSSDEFTVEYVVKSFIALEDISLEILHRFFNVSNPYFVKSYVVLLIKIYLNKVKREYDSDEVGIFIEERMVDDDHE